MPNNEDKSIWVGLIANPSSGKGKSLTKLNHLEKAFSRQNVNYDLALTIEDRQKMVRSASERPEARKILVAIGGDGTVNALINEKPSVPICNFASGTENLFARFFQTPDDANLMARWILDAQTGAIDIGQFEYTDASHTIKQRFGLMLGFGFDAAVVNRHHSRRIDNSGKPRTTSRLAYFWPLAHEAYAYRFPPVRLEWTDHEGTIHEHTGTTSIIFNLDCYALGLRFTPEASAFDGLLDAITFERSGSIQAGIYLATVATGLHKSLKSVKIHRMKDLTVHALTEPVPVQMDGDPAGWVQPGQPWKIACIPNACPVLFHPSNLKPGR